MMFCSCSFSEITNASQRNRWPRVCPRLVFSQILNRTRANYCTEPTLIRPCVTNIASTRFQEPRKKGTGALTFLIPRQGNSKNIPFKSTQAPKNISSPSRLAVPPTFPPRKQQAYKNRNKRLMKRQPSTKRFYPTSRYPDEVQTLVHDTFVYATTKIAEIHSLEKCQATISVGLRGSEPPLGCSTSAQPLTGLTERSGHIFLLANLERQRDFPFPSKKGLKSFRHYFCQRSYPSNKTLSVYALESKFLRLLYLCCSHPSRLFAIFLSAHPRLPSTIHDT